MNSDTNAKFTPVLESFIVKLFYYGMLVYMVCQRYHYEVVQAYLKEAITTIKKVQVSLHMQSLINSYSLLNPIREFSNFGIDTG